MRVGKCNGHVVRRTRRNKVRRAIDFLLIVSGIAAGICLLAIAFAALWFANCW